MIGRRAASADLDLGVVDKGVGRHLEVERRRPLADAPRRVVVRAVARAEPAIVVARTVDRHAAQVRAHAKDDERLRLLHAVGIGLRVAQLAHAHVLRLLDLIICAV
eukprot:2848104-Prymnesium_polylepis.2